MSQKFDRRRCCRRHVVALLKCGGACKSWCEYLSQWLKLTTGTISDDGMQDKGRHGANGRKYGYRVGAEIYRDNSATRAPQSSTSSGQQIWLGDTQQLNPDCNLSGSEVRNYHMEILPG